MITAKQISDKLNEEVTVQVKLIGPNIVLTNVPDAKATVTELKEVMFSPMGLKISSVDAHTVSFYKKNYNIGLSGAVKYHIEKYAKENNWKLSGPGY